MKITTYLLMLVLCNITIAQVGIGTSSPKGILDVESSTQGVVIPNLSLTATNVMAPATNPHPVNTVIPTGTVVYNTNTTTNGIYSVYPGMYVWVTDKWVPQFTLKQGELFSQVGTDFRTLSNVGWQNIPMDGNTFTAQYTGTYKIVVSVNYGGGYMRRPSSNGLNIAAQTGVFGFRFNNGSNVDYTIPMKSYSARYRSGGAFFSIWKQQSIVIYVDLDRNDTPTFILRFDQDSAPEFVGSGNTGGGGQGQGNIGDDIPCTVDVTYIGN